jgi:hypothetical protein
MPVFKCSQFFTQGRFGWSESHYGTFADHATALAALDSLRQFRVQLFGKDISATPPADNPRLEFARVSLDTVAGDSLVSEYTDNAQVNPVDVGEADIPHTCLLVRLEAGTANRRSFFLRGLPDWVTKGGGQFISSGNFSARLRGFFSALVAPRSPFGIRVPTTPLVLAGTIDTANTVGVSNLVLVNTFAAHGLLVGDTIAIKGRGIAWLRGRHRILGVTGPTGFTIDITRPAGQVIGQPKVYKLNPFVVQPYTTWVPERITHRITGRPFDLPRGRRSLVH